MVEGILAGLRWLGLDWDEGPLFQSRRRCVYDKFVNGLLANGFAYRDFSSPDAGPTAHLESRALEPNVVQQKLEKGETFPVRFRVPRREQVSFKDLVFGTIEVETDNLEDFVILRSDGTPTYHLSVVADDLETNITHVIRGADHLSNTGKHVLLYRAAGAEVPTFAHLPLILGQDKKRLSKRHGATSVTQYRDIGLLPEAVRNYIALLGWSSGDEAEILSCEELIRRFNLSRVNKANAVFDYSKLEWMNKRYISAAEPEVLEGRVRLELEKSELWNEYMATDERSWFLSVIELLKTRVQSIPDFTVYGRAFFTDDYAYEEKATAKYLKADQLPVLTTALLELRDSYRELPDFSLEATEMALREISERHEIKAGQFIGAVRLACTGKSKAPGIFDVLVVLGREKVVERLDRLIQYIR
jgi:glutamyl-tRNA synthetase